MDLSDPSSINSSDLDTMGNILAVTNENTSPADETDKIPVEPSLTSENEVTECQNIDMLTMNKSQDVLPQTSGSVDNLNICESDDNVEDLWCDTRELVKVETDEDFDVIVKSLETAIVGADKMSPILVPQSSVESDPVLLDELVSPPSLSELEVDASKLASAVSDQCLESLMDTSIIASEFASISDETFDEESTSLFETTSAVTEVTDSRPSLLESSMICDIAEVINKDTLPIIKDTLLRDDSLDSADDILQNIVNENIDSEVQIEDGVRAEMLEFRGTQNIVTEMLNESLDVDQQAFAEKSGEIQLGKREEKPSETNVTEENVETVEENGDKVTKSDSICEEILEKHEARSDIDIVNIENLTDADIFDKTDGITENSVNIQQEEEELALHSAENKTEEEIIEDIEPDSQENIDSARLNEDLVESVTETQRIEAEFSETSVEQLEVEEKLSVTVENVRLDTVRVVSEESADNSTVNMDDNKPLVQESVDSSRVEMDKLTVEAEITLSPAPKDKCETNSEQSETVSSGKLNTESQWDTLKSSAPLDKLQDIADCSASVSDTPSVMRDEHVKHALDTVGKEQSPPKKIKLIREKLYIPPVSVTSVLPSVDTLANVASAPNVAELSNSENVQINDDLAVQKSSPVRTRKLKLNRDYEPEQIVTRVDAELTKPEHCVTDEMPSVLSEQEPTARETVSDNAQCETQNVMEEPEVEQDKKMVRERDEEIMTSSETDLKADEEIVVVSETDLKVEEIDTAAETEPEVQISRDKDPRELINSAEPVLFVVNLDSEVSDAKQLEVPEDDSTDNEMPVTCAGDVPTALDNDEPITEGIREVSDAEKCFKSPDSLPDCEEPPAEIISNSEEPVNQEETAEQCFKSAECEETSEIITNSEEPVDQEETPVKCVKSPESLPDCEEPSTGIISNSEEPANEEEGPVKCLKSPESLPDCEESSAGVISNSEEKDNQEESPESVPDCEEPSAGVISNSEEQVNQEETPEKCFKSLESLVDCEEPSAEIISNSEEQASQAKFCKSPESLPDSEESSAEHIAQSPEQVNSEESLSTGPETSTKELLGKIVEENPAAMPVTSTEGLPEKIMEETEVICEEKSSGIEEIASGTEKSTSAAPPAIAFPVESKLSILQQMLMKDIVLPIKEKPPATSVVDLLSVEPLIPRETARVHSEIELAADEIERPEESTIEDELMQAAKAVEIRIDASEENDDELKQAAQEAETRDDHTEAPLEVNEDEFEDNSVSICEDEIIAVTQALEMERAQESLVEISKTESLLEICKPSVEASKASLIIEQMKGKVEDNKLKRHIEETISPVASKKSKSSKEAETTTIGRKLKSSPATDDSTSIEAARQSVTIEAVASQSAVESVGKLRISRRKLEEPVLSKCVTITKPLRVEVDDLGNASMSPSYFSDLAPQRDGENVPKIVIKPIPKPEERSSPKITIKPIMKPADTVLSPKTSKSKGSDEACTPRITIKPILKPDTLKITITKQKMDDTHSILKIYKPDDNEIIPKLTIKPIAKSDEMQHSPRITIKPVKPPNQHSPSTSMSPKITVKPVLPPNDHSPKITVKSVVNLEDSYPKVTIKPILRPDDSPRGPMSPRQVKLKTMTFESSSGVTVEPIAPLLQNLDTQMSPLKISVKSFAKMEETLSPKLTIKPITKTCEIVQSEDGSSNPLKLTIKPILKPEESYQSPKITIKPIMKPEKMDQGLEEMDKPERIILKIQKTNLPSPKERAAHSKESRKEPEVKIEAIMQDPDRNQKLDKIKLKLTKEGSHAQIIPSVPSILSEQFTLKRPLLFSETCISEKRSKSEFSGTELLHNSDISINLVEPNAKPNPKTISEEVTIVKLDRSSSSVASPLAEHISQSKFKEMLLKIQQKSDITCTPHIEDNSSSSDDVKIVGVGILSGNPLKDPLSIHDESSSQDVVIVNDVINTNPFHNVQIINAHTITDASAQQTPKKRGRPRKNPLEVKPEIKGEDCVEIVRPKRTCRAPPGRTPFAVKERKPRGAGRGRGGRGRGGASPKSPKEPKTPRGKALKEAKALAKLEAAKLAQEVVIDEITIEDSTNDTTPIATPVPSMEEHVKKEEMQETEVKLAQVSEELLKEPQHLPPPLAVYEEETRMSADNSRAQTPARQVIAAPHLEGPEESQSSVQSSATTESNKNKKGRLEVCDPDSAVTTVEQIVEYSWGAGGTYMLQEQIAQFLGVKSFKRKYPGLTRRPVEMQERDYIREKGLVSESMCDMGLTAVPSSEILDIMYTDFQEKYEEYRKCMRDKQSKEISNKQRAISLATSQEKNKIDFKERAIRSAANWNVNFNKSRKETRRCCMDLQTFTINFPLGRTQCKVPQKSPVGQYPIALVPGQFTDYYKRYTSNELHYLPLNTVRYGPVMPNQHCADAGQSDGSQSETDSSSGSDSDSSDDSMSTVEDTPAAGFGKAGMNLSLTTPKAKVH